MSKESGKSFGPQQLEKGDVPASSQLSDAAKINPQIGSKSLNLEGQDANQLMSEHIPYVAPALEMPLSVKKHE